MFNRNGDEGNKTIYYSDFDYSEYKYENSNLYSLKNISNNKLVMLSLYKYNINGIVVELKRYGSDSNLIILEKSTLNSNNQIIKMEAFNVDGASKWYITYKYQYKGKYLIKEEIFDKNAEIISSIDFDENGKKHRSVEVYTNVSNNQKDTTSMQYEYKENRLFRELHYTPNFKELLETKVYYYDSLGFLNKTTTIDNNGKIKEKYESEHDKFGNLVKYQFTNNTFYDNTEYTYTYEFDLNNNWIKAVKYAGIKPVIITERKIEYY